MRLVSANLQTAYANLLQAHLNAPAFEFEGAPFAIVRRGKTYWYVNQRTLGADAPRQRYLGPDTVEIRDRIETMRASAANQPDFREHCSRLVAQLRAGGVPALDRQTGPVLRTLCRSGVFRLGGTLVGTHAFRHYDLELGAILTGDDPQDAKLRETEDIDIASFERLSAAIGDEADPNLAESLVNLGFAPTNTLRNKPATTWRHARSAYAIDFLTPSFEEDEAPRHLEALKIWAQGLHYLDYLLKDPIPAVSVYMEGLLVQIPRPERYAVHKLIVSQNEKRSRIKSRKDQQQERAIFWAMSEDQPYELKEAIAEADARGPKWRAALDRALVLDVLPDDPIRPGDSAEFLGRAFGAPVRLRVSGTALQMLFDDDGLETAARRRARIEPMFREKFRREPSSQILLTSEDVERNR